MIVVVRDDEDTVCGDVRALARHLRSCALDFEILAVADGSHDTSLTLLRFLCAELPELTLLGCARSGRAFRRATAHAQGEVVLLWEADRGHPIPHAVLGFALSRLTRRAAVVVRGRFVLADRMRALPVLLDTTGRGDEYEARFERMALRRGLDLEIVGQRPRRLPWSALLVGTLKGFAPPSAPTTRPATPALRAASPHPRPLPATQPTARFARPRALWLRQAKPGSANAICSQSFESPFSGAEAGRVTARKPC